MSSEIHRRAAPAPRSFNQEFAARVQELLEPTEAVTPIQAIAAAVTCAALSVLAAPATSERLLERTRALLGEAIGDQWVPLAAELRAARTLCYDEQGNELYVTVSEAARRLGVHRSTIYRWLGDPERALSQEHDYPEFTPDRIAVSRLDTLRRDLRDDAERASLQRQLLNDLPQWTDRTRDRLIEELQAIEEPLTASVIHRFSLGAREEIPPSTIRRWPRAGVSHQLRGRPANVFSAEVVAEQLAARMARTRRRQFEDPPSVATLRRLARELPPTAPAEDVELPLRP